MMESLANKEARYQGEGLTLEELEGQTAELLPARIEMRRRRQRNVFISNKCNGDLINLNIIASQCN